MLSSDAVHFHDETLEIQRLYKVEGFQTLWEQEDITCSREISASRTIERHSPKSPDHQSYPSRISGSRRSAIPADILHTLHDPSAGARCPSGEHFGFQPPVASFIEREAVLMRNYIENMAPWVRRVSIAAHRYRYTNTERRISPIRNAISRSTYL